jgi:ketosteroid isomerase-like protein
LNSPLGNLPSSGRDKPHGARLWFLGSDDKVVMIGRYRAVVTAINKRIDVSVVHVFTIQSGKVTGYLNFTDSATIAEAYKTG